ncbi:MAG TPA: GNAT family N-acetyltransferase [Rectinemataceae bacterium]|nr:GNAT family N-acetyltransferase [Rectinemataceae bacterium]
MLRGLERRRELDPAFLISDAESTLTHLYIQEGNDQEGRGEPAAIALAATVAAYEHFIAEWKRASPPPSGEGRGSEAKTPERGETMSLEIRRVENLRQLKAFIRFPYRIYGGDPCWVPPLDFDDLGTLRKDKNPAFEHCEAEYWIAYRDGSPVGRIAGIINHPANEKWGTKLARFGWIDFVEDFEVAEALLRTVEDWARSKGLEGVHGPLGFTDFDREGMLVEGFAELATLATNYNRPYYPQYLERLGYAKDIDWVEFQIATPSVIPEKVLRVQELIAKRSGIHLHEWKDKKELIGKWADDLFEILEEAYAHLYGTAPLTKRQVQAYIKTYLGFVDPRFTKIVVDKDGKLIGFGITMPSLSKALQKSRGRLLPFGWLHLMLALRKPTVIDMYLIAVRPEYQSRGVVAFLMTSLNQAAIDAGVKVAESNPELETNVEVQSLWKGYEKRQHKRRRIYLKRLAP